LAIIGADATTTPVIKNLRRSISFGDDVVFVAESIPDVDTLLWRGLMDWMRCISGSDSRFRRVVYDMALLSHTLMQLKHTTQRDASTVWSIPLIHSDLQMRTHLLHRIHLSVSMSM
jgi:hypothetical protein